MSLDRAALVAAAEAWLAQDPDADTRAETSALLERIEAGDTAAELELAGRFGTRLSFGTAGLRGALGAGPNRMNRVLVGQAAAGFGRFLLERASNPTVVVGYDGRVNSDVFARDSAEIFAGMGLRAILLPRLLPTPVLAFAVRHLGADAGVMVTASHNPPEDNGYKVYLGGADQGSQIVAPDDATIAAHIAAVAESVRFDDHPRGSFEIAEESVVEAYVTATARLIRSGATAVPFVYTAMHGVGAETFLRVLDAAGLPHPELVAEQATPDGRFPTVAFPNPEEPGALDLAFATAERSGAPLIVAHDPDADRLAIAIPDGAGSYRRLSGNELGLLLGWKVAREQSRAAGDGAPSGTLACSMVSSPGLREVARAYQLDFQETPTGFKWISRADHLVFGFEEALGYLVNPADVRDKDGISAAAAFLDLASELAAAGSTVAEHLDAFVEQFGCFASAQVSVRVTDLSRIADTMARLRAEPPTALGTHRVDRVEDLAEGLGELPPADVLRIWLQDGSRVMVRPSGTEPKLKVYIDAAATHGSVAERRRAAEATVAELEAAMRALVA
ncbi:MAG TPA: phospho-sugar mutase [Microbacteriaceae bacterium]|nr:phospho-sugar mutase [Microbacteriaceae bacterium]